MLLFYCVKLLYALVVFPAQKLVFRMITARIKKVVGRQSRTVQILRQCNDTKQRQISKLQSENIRLRRLVQVRTFKFLVSRITRMIQDVNFGLCKIFFIIYLMIIEHLFSRVATDYRCKWFFKKDFTLSCRNKIICFFYIINTTTFHFTQKNSFPHCVHLLNKESEISNK